MAIYNFTLVSQNVLGGLTSEVTIKTTPSDISLNDFSRSLSLKEHFLTGLSLYSINSAEQVTQPITFHYIDPNGQNQSWHVIPRIDRYQYQANLLDGIEIPEGFDFNAISKISFSLIPDAELKVDFNFSGESNIYNKAELLEYKLVQTFKMPELHQKGYLEPIEIPQLVTKEDYLLEPLEKSVAIASNNKPIDNQSTTNLPEFTGQDYTFFGSLLLVSFGLILLGYKKKGAQNYYY